MGLLYGIARINNSCTRAPRRHDAIQAINDGGKTGDGDVWGMDLETSRRDEELFYK